MRAWQKIEYSFYRIVVYPRKERERKERKEREEERKEQTKKGMLVNAGVESSEGPVASLSRAP